MVKTVDKVERVKMVKAMEYIARHLNDEEIFMSWLTVGVADGDIEYGDLSATAEEFENFEGYVEDEAFADLMALFVRLMYRARRSGGLYCDWIVDSNKEV